MLVPLFVVLTLAVQAQDQLPEPAPPQCTADIRWVNDTQLNVNRTASRMLTIFTAISGPDSTCLPARILLAASYFDQRDEVVCSGIVELIPPQHAALQYTNIEIRPATIYEFARWRNGPQATALRWSRVSCLTPDGQSEVQPEDLEGARSLRLHATVLPAQNGVATVDVRLLLQP